MKLAEAIAGGSPFYSLEFFPPKDVDLQPKFFATVEKLRALHPLFASVTYGAGGGTQENTLGITARLAESGLTPMAHLTCVGATEERIEAFLTRLNEAGVTNVLALRGDEPQGSQEDWETGSFRYASDLVRFVSQRFPHFGVAVAAYPTPHPQSETFASDRAYTRLKLEAGGDFAVTQLFFDVREYFEFVAQMRALGVDKPIIPGVLPIQSLESIRRILSLSGGSIPAKLYLSLEAAQERGGAQAVRDAGIAFAVEQIKRLLDGGAPGIHLYTLNQAETCLRIAEEVGPL